jgi:peptidoglycan/LPS O-acetylase OafA/YrhL
MQKINRYFYPQLDSLRAIAVLLVIVSHWFSNEHFLNRYSANGVWGVTLFFVLSGFLIFGILLKSKSKIEAGYSIVDSFKVFYIRRSLRIFPIYYLLLSLLFVFNLASIRDSFWWHFFYASNFYFWIKGAFAGSLSHLWSLAVEEQFYIFCPAAILLVPRRFLFWVLLLGVFAGFFFRLLIVSNESNMGRLLTPGSFDSFFIGGLFAYARSGESQWYRQYLSKQKWFVILAFVFLVIDKLPVFRTLSAAQSSAIYLLLISFTFGILINRVSYNVETPFIKQILNNKLLIFVGKISYGMYLFHNFIPFFYGIDLPFFSSEISLYFIQFLRLIVLLSLASISWFFVEKPILKLKNRFIF